MESWYLICYDPSRDGLYRAQLSLNRKQISFFCPVLRTWRERKGQEEQKMVVEALFNGYMFVCVDPELIHPAKIEEECSGVSHFIRYGNVIKPLPRHVIETIMALPFCTEDDSRVVPGRSRPRRPPRKSRWRMKNPSPLQNTLYDKIRRIVSTDNEQQRTAMFLALTQSIYDHTENRSGHAG